MYSDKVLRVLKRKKIDIGDRIQITKDNKTFEGILMPRIEMGDRDSLVLKLDNGYNIGIKFEPSVEIKKIKTEWFIKGSKGKEVETIIFDDKLPTISIIGTGGTIASKIDYRTGGVYASFSAKDIVTQIPELKEIANIKAKQIMSIMSEDMTPERWKGVAKAIGSEVNSGVKGVIVVHGTDTLHYTAAALSFMLRNLPCPIALVGAQRSSDRGSSDTVMNVSCAVNFVANSDVAEVCIVMHGSMSDDYCLAIRGTKVRKMHTSRRDAFKAVNDIPIAKIYWKDKKIEIINNNFRKRSKGKVRVDDKIEQRVALIRFYPGLDPEIFDYYLKKKYIGFVIEGTGLGHTPTLGKHSFLPKIEKIIKKGIPIIMTSQCLYGRVHPTIYHNLRELSKRGVIFAEDMLPEVAYIKLLWILGHTRKMDKVREMMLTNYAGEITERTEVITGNDEDGEY
ncbi:MAG: glutamyl-tRNA(Gln) amidotransferase subunit D [Theionarchaea archaeon DG-70]|nr:MAG: glutamyl-tRNA(Gln) amidotransferase subunit D [Theionarchaea archaeon DG-70]